MAFHDLMNFLNIDENSDRLSEVTYFTCMKVLGEGLSKLPLALQRVTKDGGVEDMQELPLWETVKVRPNRFMSPTTFWNTVENNRNHYGNSYVWIDRKTNGKVDLWILPPDCVQIELDELSDLSDMEDITYIYTSPNDGQMHRISSMDILHFKGSMIFNGLIGMSVREKLKMSLDSAMLSQKMLNELYKNHFVPKAAVQFDVNSFVEKNLESEYLKSLQEYADGNNQNGTSFIPLLPGTNIVPLNIRLTDGQFLELRKYTALQIAAAFGIKPNHLNDYEKSSYANSETQQLAFYTDTMLYILKQYEEELNYKLLSEEQRAAGYRFKFNLAAVLRGDTKTQVESLSKGIASGLYTPDEARRNLDLPSKPGGDQLYFNGSNIPINLAGSQYGNTPGKAYFPLVKALECAIMSISKGGDFDVDYIQNPSTGRMEGSRPGGGSSSGGGSSATETKEQRILKQKVKDGELTKTIYAPKQVLHYQGTKQHDDYTKTHDGVEKSYFTVPMSELQSILDEKFATGRVHIFSGGKITEIFDCEKIVGYDTFLKKETSFVKVHYSKQKTHMVPHVKNE